MRILIVEHQNSTESSWKKSLTEEGYCLECVSTAAEAHRRNQKIDYDSLILDLPRPALDGQEEYKALINSNLKTPVLCISDSYLLADKSFAFGMGVDDYLSKPFEVEELLFRIAALIRRKHQVNGNILCIDRLKVDLTARVATLDGKAIKLTSKEFAVLELFLLKRAQILTRRQIAEHIYSDAMEQESNVIDVFINRVRQKLEKAGFSSPIETVRGEGYVIR